MKMNIKACIFDLDGTIIDSGDMIFRSIEYALQPWNVSMNHRDIEIIRARIPSELFCGYLKTRKEEAEALQRLMEFSSQYADQVVVYDQIPELLYRLSEHYKLAVWTGRDTESAQKILKRNKLDQYFEIVVGCSSLNNNKPHPEGLETIAKKLKASSKEMIVIGDHAHDVEGAARFGCHSIHVTWSKHLVALRPDDHQPDAIIASVKDLADWFGVPISQQ